MVKERKKPEIIGKKTLAQKIMAVIGLSIMCYGLYEGYGIFMDHKTYEISDDAQVEQYVVPIHVRATGYISKVYFTEHQHVKKGDTLMVLDQREYALQLKMAKANLKDAKTGGAVLEASIDRSHQTANAFDNAIDELEIRIKQLEKDVERYQNLVEKKAATPMQLEHMQVELDAAKQKLSAAKKQKEVAQMGETEARRKTGNTQAAVEKANIAVEQALLNLSYTVVVAPCNGQVGRRSIEEGQFITAGSTVTSIIPEREKWIVANFKETQTKNLFVGQRVDLSIDAIEGRTFKGYITNIAGATGSKFSNIPTDNSAGNFVKIQQRIPVHIVFDGLLQEDYNQMAAGMMAIVKAKK